MGRSVLALCAVAALLALGVDASTQYKYRGLEKKPQVRRLRCL
jgi:hypothetical protein